MTRNTLKELKYDFGGGAINYSRDFRFSRRAFWNTNTREKQKETILGTAKSEVQRTGQCVGRIN